jgi:hypothetical protein
MKTSLKLLLLALIFTVAFAQDGDKPETPESADAQDDAPAESTTTDAPAESPAEGGETQPTDSATAEEEEHPEGYVDGKGECSKDYCYYCRVDDDKNEWCERCGNGRVINGLSGPGRKCETPHEVEHCRESPVDDPLNAATCSKCERGYQLKDNACVLIENVPEGCTVPGVNDAGETICDGCENKYLMDDKSGCGTNTTLLEENFPRNCMFGAEEKTKRCNVCHKGYQTSISRRSCEEEKVTGCKTYHPNEPQKCLLCNEAEGYYATGAQKQGINLYQICTFDGWLAGVGFKLIAAGMVAVWAI